ncbi:MAG: protein kinase [Kofleriaceae bacterium]
MDSTSRVGAVLDGRYRLDRLLGEGGMGTVYRAYHLAMAREVAVKVLRGNLASDPLAASRFALEARATTRVDSPHAVKVFDFGITSEGERFMVMEYLDGRTAQRELDIDGPMAMPRAIHVARQALEALGAAHRVRVVHRDIKPENLLLMRVGDDPDLCKVLDFGVAKLLAGDGETASTALTRDGMVFGTPEFMSPEQACGQPLDGRSDLYSLGATLFTLLTGRALFEGRTAMEVLSKHVSTPPPRLTDQRGLHHLHALDQVLQRALAKRANDRFRDAEELSRALAFLEPAARTPELSQTPTMSTHALPWSGSTPDSPLGIVERPASAGIASAEPPAFSPGQTGYARPWSPPEDGTEGLARPAPVTAAAARWPWLVAVALAAGGGAMVTWLLTRPPRGAPLPERATLASASAPADAAPTDAAPRDAVPRDAAPRDAAPTEPTTPPASAGQDSRARRLKQHLDAAREARASGNPLRQLTQADLALQVSPRDTQALFLAGDALLTSGDLTRGCRYLAKIRKSAAALERARAARCPWTEKTP